MQKLSLALLKDELVQRSEEGFDVEKVAARLSALGNCATDADLDALYGELGSVSLRTDYPYVEPSSLEGILGQRTSEAKAAELSLGNEELYDKVLGAWQGRCAGCMLGKPFEGWTKEKIRRYLELADSYPSTDYVPELTPYPEGYGIDEAYWKGLVRGRIECAVRDDDLDFTILNLIVLDQHGFDFTTADVAGTWLARIPYTMTYTAERVAYANLINGVKPPESATCGNPYREWIGAQIRADMWGYAAPGRPEMAAALAHRDASLSHVKNGIYGEMLAAAMVSAAFTTQDPEQIVLAGLSVIPERCRLAGAIRDALTWYKGGGNWEDVWEKINAKYGSYSPVHTINNAAILVLGVLFGEGDFEKAITTTVMSGLDTDCNGATCGWIMGAVLGSKNLPTKWVGPLNDRLGSAVSGYSECRISELAKRTLRVAKRFSPQDRPRRGAGEGGLR